MLLRLFSLTFYSTVKHWDCIMELRTAHCIPLELLVCTFSFHTQLLPLSTVFPGVGYACSVQRYFQRNWISACQITSLITCTPDLNTELFHCFSLCETVCRVCILYPIVETYLYCQHLSTERHRRRSIISFVCEYCITATTVLISHELIHLYYMLNIRLLTLLFVFVETVCVRLVQWTLSLA